MSIHHVHIDPSTYVDKAKDIAEHAIDDVTHNRLTTDMPSVQAAFTDPDVQSYWKNLPALFGGEQALEQWGKQNVARGVVDGECHITFKGTWDQVNEAMYSPVKEQNNAAYVFSEREINLLCGFLTSGAPQIGANGNRALFEKFATALQSPAFASQFPKEDLATFQAKINDAVKTVRAAFDAHGKPMPQQAAYSGKSSFGP
jgi:hypothetical protein